HTLALHSSPTRRSSDLQPGRHLGLDHRLARPQLARLQHFTQRLVGVLRRALLAVRHAFTPRAAGVAMVYRGETPFLESRGGGWLDRKSTRLNSSHVKNS